MLKCIIKRDGSTEAFTPFKLNKWSQWASEKLVDRVSWSDVVLDAVSDTKETIGSQELQRKLIKACVVKRDWAHNLMGGRLEAALLHKELYNDSIPTCKELFYKLRDIGLMKHLNYTDLQWEKVEAIIDHNKDFNLAHFQIEQITKKYSIQNRTKKQRYESPQFTFMRMALALCVRENDDIKMIHVKNYYELFSNCYINAPSPNFTNLGTSLNGYASCCLYTTSDSAKSLAVGDHIAYIMTCMSAGIGGNLNIRSLGDPVRKGTFTHQGKLPYYKSLAGAVGANLQAGRGGACTTYYSCFDPEAEVIALLQNPTTTEDKKNRDIHFAVMMNRLFAKKVAKNEKIFTFNIKTAKDLTDLFYSDKQDEFETLYNQYETNPEFIKNYVDARKLFVLFNTQSYEVGTHYFAQIDEINRHTPHLDPIYSSNLCVAPETLLTTLEGDIQIQLLVNKMITAWNGKSFTKMLVKQTGDGSKLLTVRTISGKSLTCTEYHKWYVYNDKMQVVEKRTNELEIADKIERFIDPVTGRDILDVVLSIEDNNRYDKTYCVREPLTGKAVFNNILTGNCIEITQPTAPYLDMKDLYSSEDHGRGEVSTCSLGAIAVCNITSDEEYEKTAYYTLKMIDECIHLSDYPLPHMEVTVKKRLNAGVGIIGLATSLARAGLSYSSKEGKRLIHEIAERHAYFVIKASLKLGKELGNAPWMHKTKWPLGWLPIDTYKKTVDQIVEPTYKYDWETLRQEIITNGGIRNSSLIAHMPTESSSKASGVPNGVYPIRGNSLKKKDGSNIIDWCATDSDLLEGKYDIAWNIPTKDMIECYAIIQKFTDQAISADFYKDRSIDLTITDEEMISDYLHFVKFGQKTRYYQNSLTSNQAGEKVESESLIGCASGVCTL